MAYLSGANNDAMVNRLVSQGFIRSAEIEQAFRVVDRGEFVPDDKRSQAYNDTAVTSDKNIHISAPHFYALVLEVLKPGPDMRFLNVCSGSGYLTMLAAYLIGPGGLLHSIESVEAAFKFSDQRATQFISRSPFQNRFCHSSYSKVNIFHVENRRKYDRVYIGGSCPRDKLNFLVSFLKIGGVMVVPIQDELLKITRLSGKNFTRQTLTPVSFTAITVPQESGNKTGWSCLPDKVRQDGEKVPLALPENRDPMAKRLLSRFRALITALECLPSGSDFPQSFCFIPRTVGSVLVKSEYPEITEMYTKRGRPPRVDGEDEVDVSMVVNQMEHRKSIEAKFFWEDLRDDTLWQEMIEYCFAAGIDNEESRKRCFNRMCKSAVVKKLSQNDHHHVFHDILQRNKHGMSMHHPMMMESYEEVMMDLLNDSDSDSEEGGNKRDKKAKPDRRSRMRMMHPGRHMMPEMMMMEMMHLFDSEDAEFFFEEMPFMMRMAPMRRFGHGPPVKRDFDEERSNETTEGGVMDPVIRDIPAPNLGREWPSYNDNPGGESLSRRGQGSFSDFGPFDMIPLPGVPPLGRNGSGQTTPTSRSSSRSRAVSEARSLVENLRSSNSSEIRSPTESMASSSKTDSTPRDAYMKGFPTPMDMETSADRKRKEKEKKREAKLRKARDTMAKMRQKSGIFKPGDSYHAVPDWEMMCLLASRPSEDWTYEHDDELVRYLYKEVEKGSVMMMNTPLEKTITPDLFSDKESLELYPKLSAYSPVVLSFRSVMLKRIVHLMDSILHLVAGTSSSTSVIPVEEMTAVHPCFSKASFVSSLRVSNGLPKAELVQPTCSVTTDPSVSVDPSIAFKSVLALPQVRLLLPLSQKRQALVNALLRCSEDRTKIPKSRLPTINVDRRLALEANDIMNNLDVSVFMQVYSELKHGKVIKYRWPRLSREQWWEVKFIGEGIIDQGGGFRDSLAHIADELCPSDPTASNQLPFLIKSPNQRDEVGDYQDCYIPNPSCYSPEIYRWIGQLMGAAYRSSETLTLALSPFIWKMLLGVQLTWAQDYVTVDHDFVRIIDAMEEMVEDEYVGDLQSTTSHSVTLSDGSVVELRENGSQQPVLVHERQAYADAVRKVRMTECEEQVSWIREGLVSVIPEGLLSLITWQELEVNVCGDSEISLDDLRAQCHYSDEMASGSEQVRQLWKALESFTSPDRSRFLRFVTGRKRLPAMLTISRSARLLAEDALPTASTCANTLYLPKFSSDEMAIRRLRYAIYNCVAIDTDTNPW